MPTNMLRGVGASLLLLRLAWGTYAAPPAAGLESVWTDLASADEVKATRAALTFAASKEGVAFLKEHLKPVKVDARRVGQLLEQLDSEDFGRREEATTELDYLGKFVKVDLEKGGASSKSAEVKRRAQELLDRIAGEAAAAGKAPEVTGRSVAVSNNNGKITIIVDGKPLDLTPPAPPKPRMAWVRAGRAVAILEFVGTPEARQVLERMADGEAEAPPTQAAREAIGRLKK
jgi:hypothetical protein